MGRSVVAWSRYRQRAPRYQRVSWRRYHGVGGHHRGGNRLQRDDAPNCWAGAFALAGARDSAFAYPISALLEPDDWRGAGVFLGAAALSGSALADVMMVS